MKAGKFFSCLLVAVTVSAACAAGAAAETAVPVEIVPAGPAAVDAAGIGEADREAVAAAVRNAKPAGSSLGDLAGAEAESLLPQDGLGDSYRMCLAAVGTLRPGSVGAVGDANPVVAVVQPYLGVAATQYAPGGEGTAGTLTLEITPKYRLVATTEQVAVSLNGETPPPLETAMGSSGQNAVLMRDAPLNVPDGTPATVAVPLPAGFCIPDGTGMQVRHVGEDGGVSFVPASVSGDSQKTVTFPVTHGFSEFTVEAADTRRLTVHFDSGVGSEVYRQTDIGAAFPEASRSGWTFCGWTFPGADGAAGNLTGGLWAALMPPGRAGDGTAEAAARFTRDAAPARNPSPPVAAAPETEEPAYRSDTNAPLTVNGAYTFRITSLNGKQPSFAVGTPGVFRTELVKRDGNDYYYRITAVGKTGDRAGIYMNGGSRLLIATVGKPAGGVWCDTPSPFFLESGGTYQFRLVSAKEPDFACGNSRIFKFRFVRRERSNYFYRITATGKKGECAGFYLNGEKSPRVLVTIK